MKLTGMHRALKTSLESGKQEEYTSDEMVAHIVDAEWDERQNRSIEQKVKTHASATRLQLKSFIMG